MSSTKNKMLKKCKLKFMNRYELREKVVNIPVFVDKFIHSIKFGPFTARGIQHFSGQILLLSIFIVGVGVCRAIIEEETLGEILMYYALAFIMLYAYFSVSAAVDIRGKREVLKINLIDYLENNISVRIPQSKKEQERLDALEAQAVQAEKKNVRRENDNSAEPVKEAAKKPAEIADFTVHKKREEERRLAPEEVRELEGLLQDFVRGNSVFS